VLRIERLREAAAESASKTLPAIFTVIGVAALALGASAILPAEAQKRQAKPADEALPDPANGEPMTLVVSLNQQKVDIYRGTALVTSSKVSTGKRGYATKAGVFSILEKKRKHHSNLYSGAPMPFMQRMTWSGTALHAGVVPGYPASHGCIRLPFSFAPKLFGITTIGEHVVVARDRVAPQIIEHNALFQPLPPPEAPWIVRQDHPPQRQSNLDTPPAEVSKTLPVLLAKADTGGVAIDRRPALKGTAFESGPTASPRRLAAASTQAKGAQIVPSAAPGADSEGMETQVEDTRTHAIDPFENMPAQTAKQAQPSAPAETAIKKDTAPVKDTAPSGDAAIQVAAPLPASTPEPASAAKPEPEPVQAGAGDAAQPAAEPAKAESESAAPAAPVVAETVPTAAEPAPVVAENAIEAAGFEVKAGTSAAASVVAEMTPRGPAPIAAPATPQAAALEASLPPLSPIEEAELSAAAMKLGAGAKAMAIQAAEPRSTAPLRILVTRRTQRDRIIGVQHILSEMGYLMPLDFDGTLGRATVTAIKNFQKANDLPETGAFNDALVKKVYEVASKEEPPVGHLFVRQEFGRLFDAPVSFRDPETPLGTHLFTAMKFAPGDTNTRWMAVSLQGGDPAEVLDRLEIPGDLRRKISERLTPGSSLIVGDTAINSATLPKGADFLVWDTKGGETKVANTASEGRAAQPRQRKKRQTVRRPANNYGFSAPTQQRTYRPYPSWPW
jgi:peptidoglycan hydrolase-like protein with peptidoglycan-binding domain